MQTVTASAQGMVSQANKWKEGKGKEKTLGWSSYVEGPTVLGDYFLMSTLISCVKRHCCTA